MFHQPAHSSKTTDRILFVCNLSPIEIGVCCLLVGVRINTCFPFILNSPNDKHIISIVTNVLFRWEAHVQPGAYHHTPYLYIRTRDLERWWWWPTVIDRIFGYIISPHLILFGVRGTEMCAMHMFTQTTYCLMWRAIFVLFGPFTRWMGCPVFHIIYLIKHFGCINYLYYDYPRRTRKRDRLITLCFNIKAINRIIWSKNRSEDLRALQDVLLRE